MTPIQRAMAKFLTQNDRKPFHASGPVSVIPAKPAGTSVMAITTLNQATHRGNTGRVCAS